MTTLTDTQVITASGGLVELGYLTYNAGNVVVTSGNNSYIGGTLTCVCDGSPVLVEVFVPRVDMAGSSDAALVIEVDGVSQGRCLAAYNPDTGGSPAPTYAQIRITPTAGSHTFRMRAYTYSGTTTWLTGGGVFPDAYLRVSKIVQATQWPAVTTGTIICTSSTRPASPFAGQTIWETDTSKEYTYTGSAWIQTGPPPRRLAYQAATAPVNAGASVGAVEVFGTDASFTAAGSTQYRIEIYTPYVETGTAAGQYVELHLTNGSTTSLGMIGFVGKGDGTRSAIGSIYSTYYYTPSAGTVNLNASFVNVAGTGGGGGALTSGTSVPAYIAVYGPDLT